MSQRRRKKNNGFVVNIQTSRYDTLTLNSNVYQGFMNADMTVQDLKNLVRFVNKMKDSVKFEFKYNNINMENDKKLDDYGIIYDNKHLIQMQIQVQPSLMNNNNNNNNNDYMNSLIVLNANQSKALKRLHKSIKIHEQTINDMNQYIKSMNQSGMEKKLDLECQKLINIVKSYQKKLLNESKKSLQGNQNIATKLENELKILNNALGDCVSVTKQSNLQYHLNSNNNNDNIGKSLNNIVNKALKKCSNINQAKNKFCKPTIQCDEKAFETALNECIKVVGISKTVKTQKSKQFIYHSDFDTNGILYWIGTLYGKGNNWTNPHALGLVTVTSSGVENGSSVEEFVSRKNCRNRCVFVFILSMCTHSLL